MVKCPSDFSNLGSTFQKLVKMQHYSLPTRLLDLTENPLVALYFACVGDEKPAPDGEVLVFSVPKSSIKYFDSDTVSVISNIARRSASFNISTEKSLPLDEFNDSQVIQCLLHEIKQDKPSFLPKIRAEHIESVVCVKPQLDNPRIIRQAGAFFLFGINGKKEQCAEVPKEYIPHLEGKLLIINSKDKSTILSQLERLGITKGSLFPEVDSVALHIRDLYRTP